MINLWICLFASILVLTVTIASVADSSGEMRELYRIRLLNSQGGPIEVSTDKGRTYHRVGTVVHGAASSKEGYLASMYAVSGTVAATAVHGIRIKVGGVTNCTKQESQVISIIPREFAAVPRNYGGYISGPSGIYTDIPTGHSIFRNLAPFVGNHVFLETDLGLMPMSSGFQPRLHDTLVIIAQIPIRFPSQITLENHQNGAIRVSYSDGSQETIAKVERAVRGIGRFDATGYTGVGRINTNHTGVVTISTAPSNGGESGGAEGETRGGFMIQPSRHARTEAHNAQIMVVGPRSEKDTWLEGAPPLFSGYIGLAADSILDRHSYRVDVKTSTSSTWLPLPPMVGKRDDALMNIPGGRGSLTAVRIRFPDFAEDWIQSELIKSEREYIKSLRGEATKNKALMNYGTISLQMDINGLKGVELVTLYVDGEFKGATNSQLSPFNLDVSRLSEGVHVAQLTAVNSKSVVLKRIVKKFYIEPKGESSE